MLVCVILRHRDLGSLKANLQALPVDADGQVLSTLDLMRSYAVEDSKHPYVVQTAVRLSSAHDLLGAVHGEVNRKMRFVEDVSNAAKTNISTLHPDSEIIEVLTRPVDVEILSQYGAVDGDCDDFSMYTAALLLALEDLGFPVSNTRFVTIAADSEAPGEYSHVYVRTSFNDVDTAVDASHGSYAGWHAEDRAYRKAEHPVRGASRSLLTVVALIAGFAFLTVNHRSFRNTAMGRLLTA